MPTVLDGFTLSVSEFHGVGAATEKHMIDILCN